MIRVSRARGMAALGSAAVIFFLLYPVDVPAGNPFWHAISSALHVFMFAGLSWLWLRALPSQMAGWRVWALLVAAAALLECLQPISGRSLEFSDWMYGAGGAAIVCWSGRQKQCACGRWLMVGVIATLPFVWSAGLRRQENRAFPVLADPNLFWAHAGWTLNGVRIAEIQEGSFQVKPAVEEKDRLVYPGLFRCPVHPDWSLAVSFQTRLYWPDPSRAIFAVRVDDLPNNPPYSNRFQQEFSVTQGWNRIWIPMTQMSRTSGGRPMHMQTVVQWGVFLVDGPPLDYFLLGPVRLELLKEKS